MTRNHRTESLLPVMFVFVSLACSSSPGGDAEPIVRSFEGETLVVAQQGSLATARPTDDSGRATAAADYFRTERALFGAPGAPADLAFADATEPQRLDTESNEVFTLVSLHQLHQGAPVIDEVQMAAFLVAPGGDELRRARGRIRDPATLPAPPDPGSRSRALPAVGDLIARYDLSPDSTTLSDNPVISASRGIAGFLVTAPLPSQSGQDGRFQAIVDPRDLRTVVLENRPPCDATLGPPPGSTVQAVPPSVYVPPGLAGLRYVRIQALRLSDHDGTHVAPITRAEVRRWVNAANEVWVPQAKLVFLFDDSAGSKDFAALKSAFLNSVEPSGVSQATKDAWYEAYAKGANFVAKVFYPDRVLVLFRERGGGGWSWGPSTFTSFVSMPSYTGTAIDKPAGGGWIRNDTLLSHELGHYFGLAHTFGGAACGDAVPANGDGDLLGQDDGDAGDDVGDTNSDTASCFTPPSLTCAGGSIAFNGQTWSPPWTNVMSYHDCLPETLTQHQVGAINHTLQHPLRKVLLQ